MNIRKFAIRALFLAVGLSSLAVAKVDTDIENEREDWNAENLASSMDPNLIPNLQGASTPAIINPDPENCEGCRQLAQARAQMRMQDYSKEKSSGDAAASDSGSGGTSDTDK